MSTHRLCLAALAIAACARSSSPPPAGPTTQPPPPAPVVVAPPAPATHLVMDGGWPGSNTHRWGSRAFELRTTQAGTVEVRLHDKISFQGVGMRPEDMPPDTHQCTPWEALPPAISMPTATKCADDPATCDAIRAFYKSTAKPPAPQDPTMIIQPDHTYGRGIVACS